MEKDLKKAKRERDKLTSKWKQAVLAQRSQSSQDDPVEFAYKPHFPTKDQENLHFNSVQVAPALAQKKSQKPA